MLLPPEYAWIELVIIGTVAVFVADLIGNTSSFQNCFMNAFTTGVRGGICAACLFPLRDRDADGLGICGNETSFLRGRRLFRCLNREAPHLATSFEETRRAEKHGAEAPCIGQ